MPHLNPRVHGLRPAVIKLYGAPKTAVLGAASLAPTLCGTVCYDEDDDAENISTGNHSHSTGCRLTRWFCAVARCTMIRLL